MEFVFDMAMLVQLFIAYRFAVLKRSRASYYLPLVFFMIVECFFQMYMVGGGPGMGMILSFYIYLLYCILYMSACEIQNPLVSRAVRAVFASIFHIWSLYLVFLIMYFGVENEFASVRLMKYYSYLPRVMDSAILPFRDVQVLIVVIFVGVNQYFFIRTNKDAVRAKR